MIALIVEDNALMRRLIRTLIGGLADAIIECESGDDACAAYAANRPDCVFMDIQLPGIDGITALERIRADAKTSAIPTVALTASVMTGDRERFVKAGFDGFIAKPIDVSAFPGQVRDLIARGRMGMTA